MNKTIITTVGTSLITNCKAINSNFIDALKSKPFFGNYSNKDDFESIERNSKKIKDNIKKFVSEQNACAEISSIFAIAEQQCKNINKGGKLELNLFFVCTDTILSPLCAEVIATYLNENKKTFTVKKSQGVDIDVEVKIATTEFVSRKDTNDNYSTIIDNIKVKGYDNRYIINGLTVNNNTDFQNIGFEGLSSVITNIAFYLNGIKPETFEEKKIKNNIESTIINITGGYKGFIPVLTLICQLLEVEMQYLYEESKTIISIPKLPIQFDLSVIESLAPYLNNDFLKSVDTDSALYKFLDIYHLINDNNELSGIGSILHNHLFNGQIGFSSIILGSFIEFKLFHYFSTCNHTKYHTPIKNDEADFYAYKVVNEIYKFSEKQIKKLKNDDEAKKICKENAYTNKLGDIDLILKNEINQDTICEIKAHNTFSEKYTKELNGIKKKDYYDKVKARIEFWKHTRKLLPNEYLFVVYKIRILQGDVSEFLTDNTKIMIKHLSDKMQEDYGNEINFKVLGLWIDLKSKENIEINYGTLLQEDLQEKQWIINLETQS